MTNNPSLIENPLLGSWLCFDEAGIAEIYSGKVELGQGVQESFKRIAAAELGIPLSAIRLISGDTRFCPDEHLTAGSFSMHHGGEALRQACAAARAILLKSAKIALRTNSQDLDIQNGFIRMGQSVTQISYWSDFPASAMAQRIIDNVPDDPPAPLPPAEQNGLAARIAGSYFIHDLVLPDMLHGRMVRGNLPITGRLIDSDKQKWLDQPGIEQVLCGPAYLGLIGPDEYAVVRVATRALDEINWDPGAHVEPDYETMFDLPVEDAMELYVDGDWPEQADTEYELCVQRPYLSHASIGTVCALALFDDARLTVYSHTQGVFELRRALAKALNMEPTLIDVIHRPGSGCYGHNGAEDVVLDAALLAQATPGRPVRVVWSRRDEFGTAPLGPAQHTRVSAQLNKDGSFETFSLDITSSTHNARPDMGGAVNLLAHLQNTGWDRETQSYINGDIGAGADRNAKPPYRATAKRGTCTLKSMDPLRTSSLRGLGSSVNVTASEMLVDQIARDRGEDPAQFRLDRLDDPRASDVIAKASAMAKAVPNDMVNFGRGLAYARYKELCGYCAVVAEVSVDEEARVEHLWIAADVGRAVNRDAVINQIEGGALQAISWTLKEQIKFGDGKLLSIDWESYPILRFPEIPSSVTVELIDRPDDTPIGAGEIAQAPVAAAIGNAIYDALGTRLTAMPFNRDAIIAAVLGIDL